MNYGMLERIKTFFSCGQTENFHPLFAHLNQKCNKCFHFSFNMNAVCTNILTDYADKLFSPSLTLLNIFLCNINLYEVIKNLFPTERLIRRNAFCNLILFHTAAAATHTHTDLPTR